MLTATSPQIKRKGPTDASTLRHLRKIMKRLDRVLSDPSLDEKSKAFHHACLAQAEVQDLIYAIKDGTAIREV